MENTEFPARVLLQRVSLQMHGGVLQGTLCECTSALKPRDLFERLEADITYAADFVKPERLCENFTTEGRKTSSVFS